MPAAGTQPRLCPIADALELLGERWALLAVREMFWGVHRFSDIARNTGAPRDVLTVRLRRLVEAGVLERRQYSERPPRWSYHLTPAGRDLSKVLMAIHEWADLHLPAGDGVERDAVPHGDHRVAPRSRWSCATCGEELAD
ncbi:helix-turn-helix domain-containing protein [Conexibacter sp. SYSU D00693]|uniref:winged helix-turn-helix transcriptional regulator n=1 Tax=Conexibacter sp. SYSU D00693 TaxID=2812560 RepID=UPI00196BA686|nr:helix-turn-helix domain-containing protein [Conexibacter sp. SYSU D00693]